jgi:hypothetical protein
MVYCDLLYNGYRSSEPPINPIEVKSCNFIAGGGIIPPREKFDSAGQACPVSYTLCQINYLGSM